MPIREISKEPGLDDLEKRKEINSLSGFLDFYQTITDPKPIEDLERVELDNGIVIFSFPLKLVRASSYVLCYHLTVDGLTHFLTTIKNGYSFWSLTLPTSREMIVDKISREFRQHTYPWEYEGYFTVFDKPFLRIFKHAGTIDENIQVYKIRFSSQDTLDLCSWIITFYDLEIKQQVYYWIRQEQTQ